MKKNLSKLGVEEAKSIRQDVAVILASSQAAGLLNF